MKGSFSVIWLSGMSGSGKSTLANYVKDVYQNKGFRVRIIDGDDVRDNDNEKLNFSRKDVEFNNLRIAKLCLELKEKDFNLILVPVISPYDDVRKKTRSLLDPYYNLIYLETSIDILKKRDTKGLYNAADSGQIDDLVGYSLINPFEKPNDADLIINTDDSSLLNFSKQSLLDFIKSVSN